MLLSKGNKTSTLMIIAFDRISDWIHKGAFVSRYYNPGDLFDEVHLVLLNDETPNHEAIQKMVGRARFTIHRYPTGIPFFVKTFGWQPFLLQLWAKRFVKLAREMQPDLIRCHWGFLNGFIAREIKKALGVPYTISLHINLDADVRPYMDWKRKVRDFAFRRFERKVLQDADMVLPVYKPIVPYLERHRVKRFQVAYNVINPEHIRVKKDYTLHSPVRVVCIGRLIPLKNPENLIRAVAKISNVELTVIGNGELREPLTQLTQRLGLADRVLFKKDIPNDAVVEELGQYDLYAAHSEHWELSKTVLESFLTGLPVLLNRRKGPQVPEITDNICELVENTVEGYFLGLKRLIDDTSRRTGIAKAALEIAKREWAPEVSEARYVRIYQEILKTSSPNFSA